VFDSISPVIPDRPDFNPRAVAIRILPLLLRVPEEKGSMLLDDGQMNSNPWVFLGRPRQPLDQGVVSPFCAWL